MATKRKSTEAAGEAKGRSSQASRIGKVPLTVWVSEDIRYRLRAIALSRRMTNEELLTGVIEDLLKKHKA